MWRSRNFISRLRKYSNEIQDKRKQTLNSSFKAGVVGTFDIFLHLNKINHKNFTYNILDEKIGSVPVVFYLRKNSFFTEVVNEKLRVFASSGLTGKWIDDALQPQFSRRQKKVQKQQVLTVKKLSGAFKLTIFGWMISIVGFLCEVLWFLVINLLSVFRNCE
jgi:hypothetical protein